jgi:hypothetical protein
MATKITMADLLKNNNNNNNNKPPTTSTGSSSSSMVTRPINMDPLQTQQAAAISTTANTKHPKNRSHNPAIKSLPSSSISSANNNHKQNQTTTSHQASNSGRAAGTRSADIKLCETRLAALVKSMRAKENELALKEEELRAKKRESRELSIELKASSVQRSKIKAVVDEIYKEKEKYVMEMFYFF